MSLRKVFLEYDCFFSPYVRQGLFPFGCFFFLPGNGALPVDALAMWGWSISFFPLSFFLGFDWKLVSLLGWSFVFFGESGGLGLDR